MKMDILAILMVAFGLFAILLFILFYIYARNARNKKRENEDYEEDIIDNNDKYDVIDKDYDNLVDEDIKKEDIDNLNYKTDNVEDFKDDGSIINGGSVFESSHEEKQDEEKNVDEFVPRKKNK